MSPRPSSGLEEEVSETLVQRLQGDWTSADQAALENRLACDAEFAHAYRLAQESVDMLETLADAPEMIRFREQALAQARRHTTSRSWFRSGHRARWAFVAGVASLACVLAIAWQLSPWGYRPGQYHTGIGEQRMVELEDHSRIALDATTRIAVGYTNEARTIELLEGQAQFTVAKDPARAFRVKVGGRTIVALGTVFTVDFTQHKLRVAMMQGRVALNADVPDTALPTRASNSVQRSRTIELSAGEELSVGADGSTVVIPNADLELATAWRSGKVIFREERLKDAVLRMNRYSRIRLEIGDEALADEPISGVFEAGDTEGFLRGVRLALPVVVTQKDADTVSLSSRR